MRKDVCFSDGGRGVFLEHWNLGGCCCFAANFFYCLQLPFKLILGEVTKNCRGLDQTSKHSRPLKITGTSVSSQKENKERWGIILNHLIVNKPPDVSSKPTEKRGLLEA